MLRRHDIALRAACGKGTYRHAAIAATAGRAFLCSFAQIFTKKINKSISLRDSNKQNVFISLFTPSRYFYKKKKLTNKKKRFSYCPGLHEHYENRKGMFNRRTLTNRLLSQINIEGQRSLLHQYESLLHYLLRKRRSYRHRYDLCKEPS